LWFAGRGTRASRPSDRVALGAAAARLVADAKACGRGAVIVASHTGNWELAALRVAEAHPLTVVVKPLSIGGFDAFCTRARVRRGLGLARPDAAPLARAAAALANGEFVAFLGDQVPASARPLTGAFLGAPALLDRAPAVLAARARVPLVVTASAREGRGTHRVEVLAAFAPPVDPVAPAWIEEVTVAAAAALDRFVRANPGSWLWLHRRWHMPAPA
jgi:KDO2-lipid IV(A) lauroyltransferase